MEDIEDAAFIAMGKEDSRNLSPVSLKAVAGIRTVSQHSRNARTNHHEVSARYRRPARPPSPTTTVMPPKTFNLKQRLAALSQSTSSPSTYDSEGPSFRSTIRRKAQMHAPWMNKRQEYHGGLTADDLEQVQTVLSKMIFQAGVDYETRPMVVLNASALPDPDLVSYDLLLARILEYLNLFVEADYTVVFFAAGSTHTPGWNWVWKAYRSLSRKYRKNLKQLYIVHSSFFSKMLFSLAGAIISPKFFTKIVYISTLSELAYHVPLTQIDIPPAVYKENLKYEERIIMPIPSRSSIFGVPLEDLMGYEGEKDGLPRVIRDCIMYLHQTGMMEEGLFRRSPSSALLRAAQEAYDRGNVVSMQSFGDPHLAAVLIKKFLRDLPEPIFPETLYPAIRACPNPNDDPADMNNVTYIRESLLLLLSPCAYILLSHILQLMYDVSLRASRNRMNDYNLAIVLTPNLVKGSNPIRDVSLCAVVGAPSLAGNSPTSQEGKTTLGSIIALCIRRYYEVFDEIPDRSEAITPTHSSASQASFLSTLSTPSNYVIQNDDDDDLDDDDLPMTLGPTHRSGNSVQIQQQYLQSGGASPPSAWAMAGGAPALSFGKRHRTTLSGGTNSSGVRSVHAALGASGSSVSNAGVYSSTVGRTRSLISVEKATGQPGHRKGTISIGRSTTRKSSGAAVEAVGITAAGFFSDPKTPPPVPPRPSKPGGSS